MKTHIIYTYNGRDIESYGKTLESNSVTKLICEALAYVDLLHSKINESTVTEFYLPRPSSGAINYKSHVVDVHGVEHSFMFVITGSPATLRKARKYFEHLGIGIF